MLSSFEPGELGMSSNIDTGEAAGFGTSPDHPSSKEQAPSKASDDSWFPFIATTFTTEAAEHEEFLGGKLFDNARLGAPRTR